MADIKLKNKIGTEGIYSNISNLNVPLSSGGTVDFINPTGEKIITNTSLTDVANYAVAQVSDNNLLAENIVNTTSILGIQGTYNPGITPSGKINITTTASVDVTNYATAQAVDNNLVAENIKENITILGITGTCGSASNDYRSRFVCVGDNGSAYYSLDGINWTAMTGLPDYHFQSVTYGNGRFVCVGEQGRAYYSINGTSWTAMSGLDTSYTYYGVTYGNGRFVCVGHDGIHSQSYFSLDGVRWGIMTGFATNKQLKKVVYGNGRFITVGTSGTSYYSNNGGSWTNMSGLTTTSYYTDITYGNGQFVCGGVGDAYIGTCAKNSTSWSKIASISGATGVQKFFAYGKNKFVCVLSNGQVWYATSASGTWTRANNDINGWYITYGADKFVCVGYGESGYSEDGINWTWSSSGLGDYQFNGITHNDWRDY